MTQNDSPSDEQAEPQTKAELMVWIVQAWSELNLTLTGLTEEQLTTVQDPQGWSAKDHLVHITVWEQSLLALLQGRDRDLALGLDSPAEESMDIDEENDVVYQHNRQRTLEDVLASFQTSHQELVAAIRALSDEDLVKPYSHYQPNDLPANDRPVLGWIVGNTYEHYREHNEYIRVLNAPQ